MKNIRVLFIVNHVPPYGANVALLNMIDCFLPLGVIPFVVVGYTGGICEELNKRSIPYTLLKHKFCIYPRIKNLKDVLTYIFKIINMVIANIIAENKLEKIVNKFKPDIIHTNIGPTHIGYNVAKKMNIPHVWHIREYQDLDFNMHFFPTKISFIKKLNSHGNYNISMTKELFDHFRMQSNTQIIYDGVDNTKPVFNVNKEKYFLFVGRLEANKGIHNVINAFITFSKDIRWIDYKLLIAGGGQPQFVQRLHNIVKKADLSHRISFLGFRKDVYNLMSYATALIVASKCEGFGFITIEALINGCLVIGNNSGGTKEILEKESLGILYTGHDELVSSMVNLLTSGIQSYHEKIKNAQRIASLIFSKEQNCNIIYKYYKNILNVDI